MESLIFLILGGFHFWFNPLPRGRGVNHNLTFLAGADRLRRLTPPGRDSALLPVFPLGSR
jgi:hypothetical protein